MLIDWFTVAAQILNFLVLVWLLKRFLYRPILDAIDAREQRIAQELADADAKKAQAGQERETFEHKNAAFDKERATLLSQATDAANAERQRLLEAARQEACALSAKQQENLATQAQQLHRQIFQRTQQEVFAIARKTLSDLANAPLEDQIVATFVARLQAVDGDEKQALISALQEKNQTLVVRTAFDLSSPQQAEIQTHIAGLVGAGANVSFQTDAALIGGIELSTDGQKVAWSITQYLAQMESAIGELLKTPPSADAKDSKEHSDGR